MVYFLPFTVCAFPYILGFSENSIEIRLMVNGNLVHTQSVPHMKLITAKVPFLLDNSERLLQWYSKRTIVFEAMN